VRFPEYRLQSTALSCTYGVGVGLREVHRHERDWLGGLFVRQVRFASVTGARIEHTSDIIIHEY
jgi:hypothetical protein